MTPPRKQHGFTIAEVARGQGMPEYEAAAQLASLREQGFATLEGVRYLLGMGGGA